MFKCSQDDTIRERKVVNIAKMQPYIVRSLGSRLQSTAGKLENTNSIIMERKELLDWDEFLV